MQNSYQKTSEKNMVYDVIASVDTEEKLDDFVRYLVYEKHNLQVAEICLWNMMMQLIASDMLRAVFSYVRIRSYENIITEGLISIQRAISSYIELKMIL